MNDDLKTRIKELKEELELLEKSNRCKGQDFVHNHGKDSQS